MGKNSVGKGEIARYEQFRQIARYEQFRLFPQCFQKTFTADM